MSGEGGATRYRVGMITDQADLAGLLREILATMLPSTSVDLLPFARAAASDVDAIIVDETVQGPKGGPNAVQDLRAGGYGGGIVLLAATCDPGIEQRLLALAPARCVVRSAMGTALPEALAALSERPALNDELGPIQRELRRTQQLIAKGEAMPRIQHTLNNPLTALLAEAQLLEMEELTDEHRAAVKRIIELCRRLVGMVRGLDPGTR